MEATMLRVKSTNDSRELSSGYSVELTVKDVESLQRAPAGLPGGTSVSISHLPKEDFARVVDAAAKLRAFGLTPMPHMVARRLESAADLDSQLIALSKIHEADRMFVVAGDYPAAAGPFDDALALIRSGLLERYGVRHVGISGYPGGHPAIDAGRLWQAMDDKLSAIAERGMSSEIVTQFFFDADGAMDWLERLRARGVTVPVRLGIPGPANVATLLRFAARCGVEASTKVMARFGLSLTKLLGSAGPDRIIEQIEHRYDPAIHGDTRLHFYPFGGLEKTLQWTVAHLGSE